MHKNQVFLIKKRHEKDCFRDNFTENKYLLGQITSRNFVPGLETENVENHCPRVLKAFSFLNYELNLLSTLLIRTANREQWTRFWSFLAPAWKVETIW